MVLKSIEECFKRVSGVFWEEFQDVSGDLKMLPFQVRLKGVKKFW